MGLGEISLGEMGLGEMGQNPLMYSDRLWISEITVKIDTFYTPQV